MALIGFSSEARLYFSCPSCHTTNIISISEFFAAVKNHRPLVCADCEKLYTIEVELKTKENKQNDT